MLGLPGVLPGNLWLLRFDIPIQSDSKYKKAKLGIMNQEIKNYEL